MRSVMDERSGIADVINMLATLIRVVQEKNLLIEDVGKAAVSYIIEETSRTGENPVAVFRLGGNMAEIGYKINGVLLPTLTLTLIARAKICTVELA